MGRISINSTNTLGYAAVIGMEAYARKSVDPVLYELLKIRASVLNGCTFCVDMHTTAGLKAGIPQRKLTAAAAWRHAGALFDGRERAMFALTDAVTRLDADSVTEAIWDEARRWFSESELGALVLAISTINVWNRIAVATGMAPPIDAKNPLV